MLEKLRQAWAVRQIDDREQFVDIMSRLDRALPETGLLRAEWLLLSVYLQYPLLDKMLSAAQKAKSMFEGKCSKIILPESPWAFYEYVQVVAFHVKIGAADKEADMLEKFLSIYTQ